MELFRNILMVHDGRACCDATLAMAARLAARHGARLTVGAIVPGGGRGPFGFGGGDGRARGAATRERINGLLAETETAGRHAVTIVLDGMPWKAVVREVLHQHHDLVILGHAGNADLRGLFDSTASQVARHCPCPVWIDKRRAGEPSMRIVAAIGCISPDQPLDALDLRVLGVAIGVARANGARLDILRPWDFRGREFEISRSELPPAMYEAMRDRNMAARAESVWRMLKRFDLDGIEHKLDLIHDTPHRAVPRFVAERAADLVVVGASGVQGLGRFVSYDPAESISARTRCSVVVVKPADFAPQVSTVMRPVGRRVSRQSERIGATSGILSERIR